jgi:hypothetical protein
MFFYLSQDVTSTLSGGNFATTGATRADTNRGDEGTEGANYKGLKHVP